jgi:hypothetical protein
MPGQQARARDPRNARLDWSLYRFAVLSFCRLSGRRSGGVVQAAEIRQQQEDLMREPGDGPQDP